MKAEQADTRWKILNTRGLTGVFSRIGLIIAILVMGRTAIFAQAPQVVWAAQVTDGIYSSNLVPGWAGCQAIDASNNIIFTGVFNKAVCSVGGHVLTNLSDDPGGLGLGKDSFVAKYSNSGELLWIRQIGGNKEESINAVVTDGLGNVVILADSSSASIVVGTNSLSGTSTDSVLLAKYDSLGSLQWLRQVGGSDRVIGYGAATDPDGNLLVTGLWNGTNLLFGTNLLTKSNAATNADFVAKYDPSGNLLWVRSFDIQSASVPVIAVDSQGNGLLFGSFTGVANFGGLLLTNAWSQTLALVKLDPDGNVLWAREAGRGGAYISPFVAAIDAQGNCRLLGQHLFADADLQSTNLPLSGSRSALFVASYESNGNIQWAKRILGSPSTFPRGLVLDAAGNAYASGHSSGLTADFGGLILTNVNTNVPVSNVDGFAAKYDSGGHLLWAKLLNAPGVTTSGGGVVDSRGNLFLCDSASGTSFLNLDGIVLQTPTNSGVYYFLAKISGPAVNLQVAGNQAVISWPTNAAGLKLESATDLAGAWSPVTNLPGIVGEQLTVTNAAAGPGRYYRLRNF